MAGVAPGPAAPSREGAPWSHPRYASRCKTSARKYTGLQVEASLQLSVYAYAPAMNGLADQEDLRLRFDVLTKTKQPELHRYWTQRARAANVRFFHLAAEILRAIEGWCVRAEPGLAVQGLPVPEPVLDGEVDPSGGFGRTRRGLGSERAGIGARWYENSTANVLLT